MNMKLLKRNVIVIILVVLCLAGCIVVKPKDVSEQEPYKSMLGYKFRSKVDLWGYGVSLDQNYKGVDYVKLMGPRSASGPEIKFERKLSEKGAVFTVVRVLESYHALGANFFRYEVTSPSTRLLEERYPVVINLSDDINSPNKGLNPEEFIFVGR